MPILLVETPPVPTLMYATYRGLTTRGHNRDSETSIPYLIKYAFDENLGVLVGGDSFLSDHVPGDTASGWGDTSVTLKGRRAITQSTALGLEASVKLPTASNDLGSGRSDFTLNGIVSTEISEFDVDANVSYTRLGVADPGTKRDVLGWAVAASHDITKQWGVAGEFSGSEQSGAPNETQFLAAVSYKAEPTLVLDAGGLVGLDHAAPRYGVFAGLTMLVR